MTALRYVPYFFAALSFVLGYGAITFLAVIGLALVSVFIIAPDRMEQVRNQPQRVGKPNMLVEGGFLFVLQLLIFGMLYGVGYFLAFRIQV